MTEQNNEGLKDGVITKKEDIKFIDYFKINKGEIKLRIKKEKIEALDSLVTELFYEKIIDKKIEKLKIAIEDIINEKDSYKIDEELLVNGNGNKDKEDKINNSGIRGFFKIFTESEILEIKELIDIEYMMINNINETNIYKQFVVLLYLIVFVTILLLGSTILEGKASKSDIGKINMNQTLGESKVKELTESVIENKKYIKLNNAQVHELKYKSDIERIIKINEIRVLLESGVIKESDIIPMLNKVGSKNITETNNTGSVTNTDSVVE